MKCRLCEAVLIPSLTTVGVKANSYCDCFYRCANCRVGYSNRQDEAGRTLIYDTWERNIPVEVHAGLLICLQKSLNEHSRPTKLKRLSFQTSEDAVSWTVFRFLQDANLLGSVFGTSRPRVLFWGTEFPPKPSTLVPDITQALTDVLLGLGDTARSLSEPDVMLCTDEMLLTIEVKYGEENSVDGDHRRFSEFTDAAPQLFKDASVVSSSGYYELTRNVVFTKLLAEKLNRRWKVINLGMPRIVASANKFAEQLSDPSVFEIQTWPDVCRRIPQPRAAWFQTYLQQKGLE